MVKDSVLKEVDKHQEPAGKKTPLKHIWPNFGRNSNRAASEYGATIRHTCTCMRESLIVTFDCDSVRRHGIAKKNHQLYSIGHIENIWMTYNILHFSRRPPVESKCMKTA